MTKFNYNGKDYELTQEAYATNYQDRVVYEACATDAESNNYLIRWETSLDWDRGIRANEIECKIGS